MTETVPTGRDEPDAERRRAGRREAGPHETGLPKTGLPKTGPHGLDVEVDTDQVQAVSYWDAFHPKGGAAFDNDSERAQRPPLGAWRRWLFPGIWLVFLGQPINALVDRGGISSWVAIVLIVAFAVGYMLALPAGWGGNRTRFVGLYAAMVVLTAVVVPIAHENAFSLLVYLSVLLVAGFRRWALLGIVVFTVLGVGGPILAGWTELNGDTLANAITLPLVAMAMFGFFTLVDTNRALAAARTEVVRLAAENERSRIARDLHDLLGHSLTTITLKVGLARKLAERDGNLDVAAELAEVEEVARRSMREVRAAVSGYHEVTLAGELATSREVLRAAGISAHLPGAIDAVDPVCSELFGWVVREGVTNVVRHARARSCRITLGPSWIEVVDDGHGIDTLSPQPDGIGNGLTGLRERVEAAGGRLESGGGSGGWRLQVSVPE